VWVRDYTRYLVGMGMRQKFDTPWIWVWDGDGFFLRGWVWDNETHPRPVQLASLGKTTLA